MVRCDPLSSPMATPRSSSQGKNYVWVRIDVVEAIVENRGKLPRGWSARKRRRGRAQHWEWAKAFVISNATPLDRNNGQRVSPFGDVKLRKVLSPTTSSPGAKHTERSRYIHPVTVSIDDDNHALNGTTITLDPNNHELCAALMANSLSELPDDLTSLPHLHEPAVVECLRRRYQREAIYTYTGKILLALNPFRLIKGLYGEELMRKYWKRSDRRPPPHIYAIAQEAYTQMITSSQNQSILVSGESGAGKTVTTKIIMRYLTTLSRNSNSSQSIEAQVLQSNPILESFGNARTVRNDNSSRFGKFIEISFLLEAGKLTSASIETYLLEKVRLITQTPGERNYHIFYEILKGTPQSLRQTLHIGNSSANDFRMTCQSGTFDRRDGVDDKDTYRDLGVAMDTVGLTKNEQHDMFALICALLHCSNLTFVETGPDASALDRLNPSLKATLSLLGVSSEDLNKALCFSAIEARGEIMHKNLSVLKATKAMEALMKATYAALFTYIVRRVNQSIRISESPVKGRATQAAFIGVLDIFGFESFDVNSFEQLCINFCNEALQQQFNKYVFKLEQEEYEREGIDWSFISFPDNQDVLDLIEMKHTGILSILDEQCLFPRSTDQSFARAAYEKCMGNPRFDVTNTQRIHGAFSIEHYAGFVAYDTSNFLEKNKDELPKESTELLMSSSLPFIVALGKILRDPPPGHTSLDLFSTPSKRDLRRANSSLLRDSVGSQFTSQLRELRERINQTTPHYVRCLKPNDNLIPSTFDSLVIADQLRCTGVLEAIRVSRVGFPQRYTHKGFVQRYRMLAVGDVRRRMKFAKGKDLCEVFVNAASDLVSERLHETGAVISPSKNGITGRNKNATVGIQLGLSKVFLRLGTFEALEYLRNEKMAVAAVRLQAATRGFLATIYYKSIIWAVFVLQNFSRKLFAIRRATAQLRHRSSILIQSVWRSYLAQMNFLAAQVIAQWCQRTYRGIMARELLTFMMRARKAAILQKNWRMYQALERYWRTIEFAELLQAHARGFLARLKLKQLKREARDLRAVIAERDRFRAETAMLRRQLEEQQQTLTPGKEVADFRGNTESEEALRMKGEMERLQVLLRENSSLREGNDSHYTSAKNAAKDAELEMLRKEIAFLRSPSEVLSAVSSPGRALSTPKSSSMRKSRFDQGSVRTQQGQEISKVNGSNQSFLSPLTSFLRKISTKEAEGNTKSPKSTFMSPVRFINVDSNHSVTSTSLLDGDDEIIPDTYNIMNVSPMAKYNFQSIAESDLSCESSFRLEVHRFHNTIRQGDEDALRTTIVKSSILDKLINESDPNTGESPLHMAVRSSSFRNTNMLLDHGAVANCQDFDGNTPLHLANNCSIIDLVLEKGGGNPNIPNIAGVCPLHLAVERRDSVAVQSMLRNGADVTVADNSKWFTPLHVICHPYPQVGIVDDPVATLRSLSSRSSITRLLCDVELPFAADPNSEDWEGNTPLHHLVTLNDGDVDRVLSILLEKGGDPNAINNRGQTPLHLLSHNESLREVDLFQEMLHDMLFHGADPNVCSKSGCTALHLSLYHRDIDSAIQLMSSGASLDLIWRKPKRWAAFWNDMHDDEVLPLDMVVDEHSLHRILASISSRQSPVPSRGRCMQCKSRFGTFSSRAQNCQHCGRHVCASCCYHRLGAEYFPKFCEVTQAAWVCTVCERILRSRKDDEFLDETLPTTSYGSPTSF